MMRGIFKKLMHLKVDTVRRTLSWPSKGTTNWIPPPPDHLQMRRTLAVSSCLRVRKFDNKENVFLLKVVTKSDAISANGLSDFEADQSSLSADHLKCVKKFVAYSEQEGPKNLEDSQYDDLASQLWRAAPVLPDSVLVTLIRCLTRWPPTETSRSKNFAALWNNLDVELQKRLSKVSHLTQNQIKKALEVSNLWFDLGVSRNSRFNRTLSVKLIGREIEMEKNDFLNALFLINLMRTTMTDERRDLIEAKLLMLFDELTFDEVGMACLAFFKTQTEFKNSFLITRIIKKAINEEGNDISLAAVFKALRFSKCRDEAHLIRDLIKSYVHRVGSLSMMSTHQLCRLSAYYFYYSREICDESFKKLYEDLDTARFKDIEGILRTLAEFNHKPSTEKLDQIIDYVASHPEEVDIYPRLLFMLLNSLSVFEVYPENLIEKCFSPEFTALSDEKKSPFPIDKVLLTLYTSAAIECHPRFKNQLLTSQQLEVYKSNVNKNRLSAQDIMSNTSKGTTFEALLRKLYLALKFIYNDQAICRHILPYTYHPDILIVPKKRFLQSIINAPLEPNSVQDCTVVSLKHVTQYADKDCMMFNGFHSQKIRLLSKMGFKVIEVPWRKIVDLNIPRVARNMSILMDVPIEG